MQFKTDFKLDDEFRSRSWTPTSIWQVTAA